MAENAGRVRDKNYERRLEAEAERDEAVAELEAMRQAVTSEIWERGMATMVLEPKDVEEVSLTRTTIALETVRNDLRDYQGLADYAYEQVHGFDALDIIEGEFARLKKRLDWWDEWENELNARLIQIKSELDDFERIAELREKEVMKLRERYDIKRDANRF